MTGSNHLQGEEGKVRMMRYRGIAIALAMITVLTGCGGGSASYKDGT